MKLNYLFIAILTLVFTACNTAGKKTNSETKEISIGMVDGWAEGVAMTHVAKEILTEQGYTVKVKKAAVDLVFASLANGDLDVFMDAWLPITHKEKVAKFGNKIESLGTNFDAAKIGLVVPSYVTINSIEELNANKDKFDKKIIGIEKGAGITAKTDLAIKDYNLDLEQINSSSVAMLTELKKAIMENRWIVVAGWAPHWKFGVWNLKFLEDPKKVFGETEHIETYSRKSFKDSDKFAANFFNKFHFTNEEMSALLAKMQEGDKNKDAVAKQWVADNQSLVSKWLKE